MVALVKREARGWDAWSESYRSRMASAKCGQSLLSGDDCVLCKWWRKRLGRGEGWGVEGGKANVRGEGPFIRERCRGR
jgi:hypothetical protein